MEDHRKLVVDLVDLAVKTCRREALEDRCIKALSKLEAMDIHIDVFPSTNIGKLISDLESDPHLKPIVQDYASSLLLKWTRQLYKSHIDYKPYSPPINPPTNHNPNPNPKTKSTTSKVKSSILKKKLMIMKKQQPLQPRKPSVQSCDQLDAVRNQRRQLIFEGLEKVLRESSRNSSGFDPIGVAISVEAVLFKEWGISNNFKYRSFLFNLRDPKNQNFRRKVLIGEVKPEKVAMLTPEDMLSDKRRTQIDSIRDFSLNRCIVGKG